MRKRGGVRWPSYGAALLAGIGIFTITCGSPVYARQIHVGPGNNTSNTSEGNQHQQGGTQYLSQQQMYQLALQSNTPTSTSSGKIYVGTNAQQAAQSSFNEGPCGSGVFVLNQAGVAVALVPGTSVTHATCSAPGSTPTPITPPPPDIVLTHWIGHGPMYFNGCQSNPPEKTVANLWMANTSGKGSSRGTWSIHLAPGEPLYVPIQAPQAQTLVMGQEPMLHPGEVVPPSGKLRPSPSFWQSMVQEQATSAATITNGVNTLVLPGPMWAIWSQKMYPETTTQVYTWQNGEWVLSRSKTVTGRPIWRAGESYNVESCPAPIVTITQGPGTTF